MDFRAGRGRVKSLLIHGGGAYLLSWCYMHLVLIHPPGGPIPSQSQSQLYHHCAWNSVCPSVCTSVLPSVRPFVCLQLQSIQIQKTGKFLFTLSHDDAPHPHHNHLHHLFQKCPSFNIPNCLANIFCPTWLLSKEGRVWCFQKFCQFISRFPITYNPTLHTPVQSEAPHRYLNTHPSSLPTQPHRYGSGSNVEGRLRNTNNGGNLKNQTNATMPLLMQVIWGDSWKGTVEKSKTNATNVTLHHLIR